MKISYHCVTVSSFYLHVHYRVLSSFKRTATIMATTILVAYLRTQHISHVCTFLWHPATAVIFI